MLAIEYHRLTHELKAILLSLWHRLKTLLGSYHTFAHVKGCLRRPRRLLCPWVFNSVNARHFPLTPIHQVSGRLSLLKQCLCIVLENFLLIPENTHRIVHGSRRRCQETLVHWARPLAQDGLGERVKVGFITVDAAKEVIIQRLLLEGDG